MNAIITFLKKPIMQAVCIGAFGGMSPKLIELVPKLFVNIYPSGGTLLGLLLLAVIGAVIVRIYKELDLTKALVLGAGAPAILATLTAQAVAPNTQAFFVPFEASIVSTVFAQSGEGEKTIRLVVVKNESPYALNSLWLRADGVTVQKYRLDGDTLFVPVSQAVGTLRVDLPSQGGGLELSVAQLLASKNTKLAIVGNRATKDFWETFGNKKVAEFRLEKIE